MKVELSQSELTVIITSLHLKAKQVKDAELSVKINQLATRLIKEAQEN